MIGPRFTASVIARYPGRVYAAVDCGLSGTHYMTCSAPTEDAALKRARAEARALNLRAVSDAYESVVDHERRSLMLRALGESGRQDEAKEKTYAASSLVVSEAILSGAFFRLEARNETA